MLVGDWCLFRAWDGYDGFSAIASTLPTTDTKTLLEKVSRMIDPLIAEHDELPASPTESSLLVFHRGIGEAPESPVDRKPAKRGQD